MVNLPHIFVATKYPGYFFNTLNKTLYSLKVSGILTPLSHQKPNRFNNWGNTSGGYKVSVNGRKRIMFDEYLLSLQPGSWSEIPMKDENNGYV